MKKSFFWCGLLMLSLNCMGAATAQTTANTAIQTGDLFVADARVSRIFRIDPSSGRQTDVTNGIPVAAFSIAIAANGDLFIANAGEVARINPITGNRTLILECPGVACAPIGIAIGANGQLVGVGGSFGPGADRVVLIDPITGALTTISSGGFLSAPIDVTIAKNGDVYVLDLNGIIRLRYDAATQRWVQSLVSSGGLLQSPGGFAMADNGDLIVADLFGEVLRVDPVSGAQVSIASASSLSGHGYLAIAPNGDIFLTGGVFQKASVIRLRLDPISHRWLLKTITAPGQLQEPLAIAVARRPVSNVNLEAAKDAYFRRDLAIRENDNYGRQDFVEIGTGREPVGDPDAMRASVQFDLARIPAAQLQTATLELTIHSFDNGAPTSAYQVAAHQIVDGLLAIWNEGNGFEGSGGPPGSTDPDSAYGVAWRGAGDNPDPLALNNETQPDFDRVTVASKSVKQGAAHAGDVVSMDVTSLVAAWLNGRAPNFGIMLTDTTTDGQFRGIRFGAREGKLFGLAGSVAGPRLVIHYKDGDINGDGRVDSNDVQAIMAALNQAAGPQDPRDIDGDGKITILDARKVTLLCSRPQCAPL